MDGLIARTVASKWEQRSYAALVASIRSRVAWLVNSIVVWLLSRSLRAVGIALSDLFAVGERGLHRWRGVTNFQSTLQRVSLVQDAWNEAFLNAAIPLKIKGGSIDEVSLHTGLNVYGKLSLRVRGIYVLVNTTFDRHHDADAELKNILRQKRALIRTLDRLDGREGAEMGGVRLGLIRRFLIFFLMQLIRKGEVILEGLHIRLEDEITMPKRNLSAGVSVEYLRLGEDQEKNWRRVISQVSVKALDVFNCSIYWNPNENWLYSYDEGGSQQVSDWLCRLPHTQTEGYSFVLKPCSTSASLSLKRGGSESVFELNGTTDLKEIQVQLTKEQVRVITESLGFLQHLRNTRIFVQYRPVVPVHGHAKRWWDFALKCVNHIQNKWNWFELHGQAELRRKYQELYALSFSKKPSQGIQKRLQSLEDEMNLLNIMLARKKVEESQTEEEILQHRKKAAKIDSKIKPAKVWFSFSGKCGVTEAMFYLKEDDAFDEQIYRDVFSVTVGGSQFSLIKDKGSMKIQSTVEFVKCLGVSSVTSKRQELLNWKKFEAPVFSASLLMNDSSITDRVYSYEVTCSLQPAMFIVNWKTVEKLIEFMFLIRKTHHDLKALIAEKVREVERESRRRIRHFIRNKQIASVSANISLPTVVIPDISNNRCSLVLRLGQLNIETEALQVTTTSDLYVKRDKIQEYKASLVGLLLSHTHLSKHECWDSLLYDDGLSSGSQFGSILCKCGNAQVSIKYTTTPDKINVPSCLAIHCDLPAITFSISDAKLAEILYQVFTISKHLLGILHQKKLPAVTRRKYFHQRHASLDMAHLTSTSVLTPQPFTNYRDVQKMRNRTKLSALTKSRLRASLLRSTSSQEDTDSPPAEDYELVFGKLQIKKIQVSITRVEQAKKQTNHKEELSFSNCEQPYLSLDVDENLLMYDMRERTTRFCLQFSSVLLRSHFVPCQHSPAHSHLFKDANVLLSSKNRFFTCNRHWVDPLSIQFKTSNVSVEEEWTWNLGRCVVRVHLEVLKDILFFASNISLPPLRDLVKEAFGGDTGMKAPSAKVEKEQALHLQQCSIVLSANNALLADATLMDLNISLETSLHLTKLNACLQNLLVTNCLAAFERNKELLCSCHPDKTLLNMTLKMKEKRKMRLFREIVGNLQLGAIRVIYLHNFIRCANTFCTNLYQSYVLCLESVSKKLTASIGQFRPGKKLPHSPYKKTRAASLSAHPLADTPCNLYNVMTTVLGLVVVLPGGSHEKEGLRAHIHKLTFNLQNHFGTSSIVEDMINEPDDAAMDSVTPMYWHSLSQSQDRLSGSVEAVKLRWTDDSHGPDILKVPQALVSRPFPGYDSMRDAWKLKLSFAELCLTGPDIVCLSSVLSSNFSEEVHFDLQPSLTSCDQTDLSSKEPSAVRFDWEASSLDPRFSQSTPHLLEIDISQLTCTLLSLPQDTSGNDKSGSLYKLELERGRGGSQWDAVARLLLEEVRLTASSEKWLSGAVYKVLGVQSSSKDSSIPMHIKDTDPLDRILHGDLSSPTMALANPVLKFNVKFTEEALTFELSLDSVSIYLWPTFLLSLLVFLKQWREANSKERCQVPTEREDGPFDVANGDCPERDHCFESRDSQENFQRTSTPVHSQRSMNVHLLFNECSIALLEDPAAGESTSPGLCVELHSFQAGQTHAAVLKYGSCARRWWIELLPCQLRARLCIQAEQLIPLNQVIHPCCPSVLYAVSEDKVTLNVEMESTVIQLTNEMVEVLWNFYRALTKVSSVEEVTVVISGEKLYVPFPIEKDEKLPPTFCLPAEGEDVFLLEPRLTQEVKYEKVAEVNSFEQAGIQFEKEEEYCVKLPEVVINFDIMCGGESSTLMCLCSSINAAIQRSNSNIDGKVSLCAIMYVYNEHVASWEPLLEPIENHALEGYQPYTLDIKIFRGLFSDSVDRISPPSVGRQQLGSMTGSYGSGGSAFSSDSGVSHRDLAGMSHRDPSVSGLADLSRLSMSTSVDLGPGQPAKRKKEGSLVDLDHGTLRPRLVVVCTSNSRLELTVTPASVKAILMYYKAMEQDHRKAMANIRNCIHDTRLPMQVENKTNMDLNIYPGPTFQDGATNRPFSRPIAMHSSARKLRHLPSRKEIKVPDRLLQELDQPDAATDGPDLRPSLIPSPLEDIPEEKEMQDDVFSPPQRSPTTGSLFSNPESSLPLIGKVFLFLAKRDSLGTFQDYDDSSESESDDHECLSQSQTSLTSSTSESVHSESCGGEVTSGGEPVEETDYHDHDPLTMLHKSGTKQHPLVKKRDYWQPKNLIKSHKIKLQCLGCLKSRSIPVSLPGVCAVSLRNNRYGRISVICETRFRKGVRRVILRSGLQMKNLLPVIVSVYAAEKKVSEVDRYECYKDVYNIPVSLVIGREPLSISVGNEGEPCQQKINWWKMAKGSGCPLVLHCPDRTQNSGMFYVKASIEKQPAVNLSHGSASHMITLEAPLTFANHLPFDIAIGLPAVSYGGGSSVKRGSGLPVQCLSLTIEEGREEIVCDYPPHGETSLKIEFKDHDLTWRGKVDIKLDGELNTTCSMQGYSQRGTREKKLMYVGVHRHKRSSMIKIYSPFWLINKTGLDIETEHQAKPRLNAGIASNIIKGNDELPCLITFKSGKTDERKKMRLRVLDDGKWCKEFAIGTVGQAVRVEAKKKKSLCEFSVVTNLLKNTLTSILYLLPKYSILNETQHWLTCTAWCLDGNKMDAASVSLQPQELKPFWPGQCDRVALALKGSDKYSVPFSLDSFRSSVIMLQDQAQTLVTTSVHQDVVCSTVVASLLPAKDMSTLIELFNLSKLYSVKFMQNLEKGSGQMHILQPEEKMMYTWDSPTGRQGFLWQLVEAINASWLSLSLEEGQKSGKELVKVVMNEEISQIHCCWLSMFQGTHRKLWFFDNPEDLSRLMELNQASDSPNLQLVCSLEGLGISLVNNTHTEVAYASIVSSPITWMRKSGAQSDWNLIKEYDGALLEMAWRLGESSLPLRDEIFDLDEMVIRSSQGGSIQRSFNPGIWLSYSEYDQLVSCSIKLGKIQVDNQLKRHDLPSRVVFAAKELKYEAEQSAAPFLDLFIIKRAKTEKHGIHEYQKVFVKVKPMQLNLELGFVAELLPFSDTLNSQPDRKEEEIQEEVSNHDWAQSLHKLLHVDELVAMAPKHHFGVFQISHADLVVNYTTAGEYDLTSHWGQIVDAIIHLAILTRGSFDINFKSVTLKNETIDIKQLQQTLLGHYRTEILWQFQNFALGLDLIGNPVRLMANFEMGAKDLIMMSHKGIIEGEVGFGIALGVKSFLGHIVGGAAQAAAGTTGAISSMLLAATDQDYQKSHRHLRNKTSEGLVSSVKLGSRFFVKGMVRGATDIFVKPVTGAAKEGVAGFFRGLGRGTVSILTKPTLGVFDLAKCTMEGIRSAVDDDASIQTVRYPRLIHENKVLVPYNAHEAEGLYILSHMTDPLEKEQYVTHDWLQMDEQSHSTKVILVSSKKVMLLQKQKKQYQMYWSTPLTTIKKVSLTRGTNELLMVISSDSLFKKKHGSKHTQKVTVEDSYGAKMLPMKIKEAQDTLKKSISVDGEYGTEL